MQEINNKQKNRLGFTIIEVVLFIAISGALFIVIYNSINGTIARSQFNEAARDLQAKIQLHFNETLNGISDGATNDCVVGSGSITFPASSNTVVGDNKDCLTLGKLITVRSSGLDVELLAGRRLENSDLDQDNNSLIQASYPTVYKNSTTRAPQTIEYRWDSVVASNQVTIVGNGGSLDLTGNPMTFAFIRSPRSGTVLTIGYLNSSNVDYDSTANPYGTSDIAYDAKVDICLSKEDNHAIITVGNFINSSEVTLRNVEACP